MAALSTAAAAQGTGSARGIGAYRPGPREPGAASPSLPSALGEAPEGSRAALVRDRFTDPSPLARCVAWLVRTCSPASPEGTCASRPKSEPASFAKRVESLPTSSVSSRPPGFNATAGCPLGPTPRYLPDIRGYLQEGLARGRRDDSISSPGRLEQGADRSHPAGRDRCRRAERAPLARLAREPEVSIAHPPRPATVPVASGPLQHAAPRACAAEPRWREASPGVDPRAVIPVTWSNVDSCERFRLDMYRHLDLETPPVGLGEWIGLGGPYVRRVTPPGDRLRPPSGGADSLV